MKALTPGEVIIFAATYSAALAEHFSEGALRYDRSLTREQAEAGWSQEVGLKLMADASTKAADTAASAVLIMRNHPPPTGAAGAMVRQILGVADDVPMPPPPELLPAPPNRHGPPPGWMMPEVTAGQEMDAVHRVPSGPTAEDYVTAANDRKPLAEAWRLHEAETDPPGYDVRLDGPGPGWRAALLAGGDAIVLGIGTQASCRMLCWACADLPEHVGFWLRFGRAVKLELQTVLAWSLDDLSAAWRYLLAMADWRSREPEPPRIADWPR